MNAVSLLVLSFIYLILTFFYICNETEYIQSQGSISMLSIARLMYAFVFGGLQTILYYREYSGLDEIGHIDLSHSGIVTMYLFMLATVVGYFLLTIAFKVTFPRRKLHTEFDYNFQFDNNEDDTNIIDGYYFAGTVLLIIGWISLYLWTRAYGSIGAFIESASRIRSGYGEIPNSLAFFKHFAKTLQYTLFLFLAVFLEEKRKTKKIFSFFLLILSIVGCITYLLASDSRVSIGYIVIVATFIHANRILHTKNISAVKCIFRIVLFFGVAYLAVTLSEIFMNAYRYNGDIYLASFDIFSSIENEFRFVVQGEQKVIYVWYDGTLKLKLLDDIVNGLVSWLPTRLIFIKVPQGLWSYNTELLAYQKGTLPTDLLTAGIYQMGIIGIFISPFVFGCLVKFLNKKLRTHGKYIWHEDILYYGISTIILQSISHCKIENIIFSIFPAFIYWIVVRLCFKFRVFLRRE